MRRDSETGGAADSPRTEGRPREGRPAAGAHADSGRAVRSGWTDGLPAAPRRGAIAGAGAFVVGYVLTGVAVAIELLTAPGGDGSGAGGVVQSVVDQLVGIGGQQVVAASGGEIPLALRTVGWTFLSAQGVPLSGSASGFGQAVSGTVDVLTLAETVPEIPLSPPVYFLIPPVALVGAGWLLARRTGASSPSGGAAAGAQIVVGYLSCVAVASLLLGLTVDVLVASVTAKPDLASAVLAGTAYAAVAGAAGGVLGAWKTRA